MVHFQIVPTADPTSSLNTMFQAAPDYQPGIHGNGSHREGYEVVGEGPDEGKRDSPGKYCMSCIVYTDDPESLNYASI